MKRLLCGMFCMGLLVCLMSGCTKKDDKVKIGVSFGVGAALRWESEKTYMEERAKDLGVDIEVRLNKTDEPLTQEEDCKEMIDQGIDVLILTPRDVTKVSGILAYAKEHDVDVVSYARVVTGDGVDLFVGYDSEKIGLTLGQYLTEEVYKGDYIILRGDENDQNAKLLYDGSMREIDTIKQNINFLLDSAVKGWDPAVAKELVKEAVTKNNNQVDAILAPNDKIAGACAEALTELGVKQPVVITGMDAELEAVKRILNGKQSVTIYMDLRLLSSTAVEEAVHLAKGEKVTTNAKFRNSDDSEVDANLINGFLITDKNVDKILIDSGNFTKEQVYGE